MASYYRETETKTKVDENGNEVTSKVEKKTKFEVSTEPDYIKLYTKMWCEFNQIPNVYRQLFLELVSRMSYCDSHDKNMGQLVNTGKPWSEAIMANLHWKEAMYNRGLKELCKCNAIKRVGRGVYQINPNYAGKGEWKYNPKLERGGIEDLVATFNFKTKEVETNIVWADDGDNNCLNDFMRQCLNVKVDNETVLKETKKKNAC